MDMSVYEMSLWRDENGRIVEKTETVAGRPVLWTYSYDEDGRLFGAIGRPDCLPVLL